MGLCFLMAIGAHAVEVTVSHPTMDQSPGYPAIIPPGGDFPELTINSPSGGTLHVTLMRSDPESVMQTLTPLVLVPGTPAAVTFDGSLPPEGVYRIDLRIHDGESIVYRDAYSFSVLDTAALPSNYSKVAHPGPGGVMRYIPDLRGNRIPDFSGVGYRGGADIPDVPTVLTLSPEPGDATQRIQNAIDQVSALAPDSNGHRGAVKLEAGLYEIGGTLRIQQSGVVLRGGDAGNLRDFFLNPAQDLTLAQWLDSMAGTTSTVLVATGPDYRVILTIAGTSGISIDDSTSTEILDEIVPVGRRWFHVANPEHFEVGDTIQLERRGNADWISYIKMDQIPPRPDGGTITQWTPFDLQFEYIITAIDGDRITVDSGLVNAVEQRWGGGRIQRFSEGGRIRESGVEDLRAVSFWQIDEHGQDDTAHADQFVVFDRMRDGWARNIAAEHFTPRTAGMFRTGRQSLGITIEDSSALAAHKDYYFGPDYDSSGRYHSSGTYVGRYGFHFGGQNGLVRNCYAINSRHAFTVSSRVSGPNVFSDSVAEQSLTYSEPHHRWSVGGLYDNVEESHAIALMNRLRYGTGHGWAGANYVAWNTKGGLVCEQPPTAQNWAIGHVGSRQNGPFHSWNLDNYGLSYGYWESRGQHVTPTSLYTQQLADHQARSSILLLMETEDATVLPTAAHPLSATAFSYDGGPISYTWTQLSGPPAVFADASSPQTTVEILANGTYVFELTVVDGDKSNSAQVTITVDDSIVDPIMTSAALLSVDAILGRRQESADPLGYYVDDNGSTVGVTGSNETKTRRDLNVVYRYELPTLPVGEIPSAFTFSFQIASLRDHSGDDYALDVYLLDSEDPTTTGDDLFYHGPNDPEHALVGSHFIPTPNNNNFVLSPPVDLTFTIDSGPALDLLQSFYTGNVPNQTSAAFRFNLDQLYPVADLTSFSINRYMLNNAVAADGFEIQSLPGTFNDWVAGFNLDPSQQSFGDDADGDGIPNAIEAWFGTHPGEFSTGITGIAFDGLSTTFTHPRNLRAPTDLNGSYEWSPNLVDWYAGDGVDGPDGGARVHFQAAVIDQTAHVTATASAPMERMFVRVVVRPD